MVQLSPVDVLTIARTLVFVFVGFFVLYLGPRRPLNWAFAVYAIPSGISRLFFIDDLAAVFGEPAMRFVFMHLRVTLGVGLIALALLFPRPLPRAAWVGTLTAPALLGLAMLVHQWMSGLVAEPGEPAYYVVLSITVAATPYIAHLLPARFAADRVTDEERPLFMRLAALFLIVPGISSGLGLAFAAQTGENVIATVLFVSIYSGGALLLWIWAASRAATPAGSRSARNLVFLAAAIPLATMLALSILPDLSMSAAWGVMEAVSILFMLAFAYAIVRHRLLGIDVKVRWTLSKSTVAAVFIAVFFIASEAAQEFFGDTLGSAYVGIAAAGALVFAITPLQRAAERLAERAVPATVPPEDRDSHLPPAHAAYTRALRLALRDGRLSEAEELEVARLAEDLDIGAGTALVLRREVEADIKSGGDVG